MRKYLPFVSISILILTFVILEFYLVGNTNVPSMSGDYVLISGVVLSILSAILSKKGPFKRALLITYGCLIGGYLIIVIAFMVGLSDF
ncbi:hypothetical protein [Falsibacillus pallidus]|uniref:Uncharacterized protein n=1 Tax=Falsibacillus pallidus TaxID=493781 RepID=A0A370FZD0_9BACI|nr:hypothetical protein [Falsibacillus pallidus]RDI36882.1 hypothetical protein DFR59_1257 [Falsibacillus pallidus]